LISFDAPSLIDDSHQPAECLILAFALLLAEILDLITGDSSLMVIKVHDQSLNSQFECIQCLGLNLFHEILIGNELLVVRKRILREDTLIVDTVPIVILFFGLKLSG
jgi:hypothetical protein